MAQSQIPLAIASQLTETALQALLKLTGDILADVLALPPALINVLLGGASQVGDCIDLNDLPVPIPALPALPIGSPVSLCVPGKGSGVCTNIPTLPVPFNVTENGQPVTIPTGVPFDVCVNVPGVPALPGGIQLPSLPLLPGLPSLPSLRRRR